MSDTCEQCGHGMDPHVLIATTGHPVPHGGIMFCPEQGCECYSTWSIPPLDRTAVNVPSPEVIAEMREEIQNNAQSN